MTVSELIDSVDGFEKLTQKEQVKLVAFFYCHEYSKNSINTNEIKKEFQKQSLPLPTNISSELNRLKKEKPPILIIGKDGLEFHRTAKKQLEDIYLGISHKRHISKSLRDLIPELRSKEQQKYLEEAISCFEIQSYRASVILTWLLTIDTLYEFILSPSNLIIFNNAIQTHGKYKKILIVIKDDFGNIKESDFIELLRVAKLITNDIRKILDEKLGLRNSCAHPSSIIIQDYQAINFIQDLTTNILKKFQ